MSQDPAPLRETQESYEKRFNCLVCMCPHIEMVTGMCQHKVCAGCLYADDDHLKEGFKKCPVCQRCDAFPSVRPEIPEDNKMMMQCLGVRVCPNHDRGCQLQMWEWEIENHLKMCASQPLASQGKVTFIKPTSLRKKQPKQETKRLFPRTTRSSICWTRSHSRMALK